MYDPTNGVWVSEDPIGFEAGDENLTRYVGNNPTNFIDPSGLVENNLHHAAASVTWKLKNEALNVVGGFAFWPKGYASVLWTSTDGQKFDKVEGHSHYDTRWLWDKRESAGEMQRGTVKDDRGCDIEYAEYDHLFMWGSSRLAYLPIPAKWYLQPGIWGIKKGIKNYWGTLLITRVTIYVRADGKNTSIDTDWDVIRGDGWTMETEEHEFDTPRVH